LLFAFDQVAQSPEFRALAEEKFDLFFANYVLSAPFACALPHEVIKIVETIDLMAGLFRTTNLLSRESHPSASIQFAEERFVLNRLEVDLYRAFDRAMMISVKEAESIRAAGYPSADYVPQPFPLAPGRGCPGMFEYDLVFVGSENHLNTRGIHWFYRHIFVPYLRRHKVRMAVAGRVCGNLGFEDAYVTKLGFLGALEGLYDSSKLVVVPILEGTGMAIKLHEALAAGKAVVSTPVGCRGIDPSSSALACVDMQKRPRQTADIILNLLKDDEERRALESRAVELIVKRHSPHAYEKAMDHVIETAMHRRAKPAA
jgi:hypothetical protein